MPQVIEFLARPAGLEPATFGSEVRRSIQLSYGRPQFQAVEKTYLHSEISKAKWGE